MSRTVFFFGEPIPDWVVVVDQLGRRFLYHNGQFTYHGRVIPAVDLDWPLHLEDPHV